MFDAERGKGGEVEVELSWRVMKRLKKSLSGSDGMSPPHWQQLRLQWRLEQQCEPKRAAIVVEQLDLHWSRQCRGGWMCWPASWSAERLEDLPHCYH
jgi:hypothetical protein